MSAHPTELQQLLAEAPFVRSLARQLLADEPDDAVQQAYLQAIQQRAARLSRPRSWLARVVRNLVADQRRRSQRRDARERVAAVAERVPSPAELLALEESRREVITAVNRLPDPLRVVILLRYYEDLPPRRIAAALDLPVARVWELLRSALAQLRSRLDADHRHDRRAWLLALAQVAVPPRGAPWPGPMRDPGHGGVLIGVVSMTAKTKVIAAALAFASAALYLLWPAQVPPAELPAADPTATPGIAAAAADNGAVPAAAEDGETVRREIPLPSVTDRGDLLLRLRYGDDHSPAADVMVTAFRKNEIPRISSAPSVGAKRYRTDADGLVRFPSMRAGRTGLIADRGHWFEDAQVVAGKETEVEWVMPKGVTITGIVVSAAGAPVAGADVELESSVVATTDAFGNFTVRGAAPHYAIGARALGHGASPAQNLLPHGDRAEVRIVLGAAGGVVEGTAVDPDGRPLANARVDVGRYQGGSSWVGDAPPRPARARTDADGRFRAIGIPLGEQQVRARASGFVPWSGNCIVNATEPAQLLITFARGNTLRGSLRDADGRPFGDVLIGARAGELDWDEVVNADGTFAIDGLPDGEVDLKVDAEGAGEAHARVQLLPGGAVTTCELLLARGLVVKGKVRDEAGLPLPRVSIRWTPTSDQMGYTFTDQDGAFTIANAPEGKFTIRIDGEEIVDGHFEDIDPRGGELDLRARRRPPKTVYITGTVLGPDGRPAVARAWTSGGGTRDILEKNTDAAGFFEIGPVCPGEWYLGVESRQFPRVTIERRTLDANSTWDVGTIRLEAGGDVHVEVVEGDATGVGFTILDARQKWSGIRLENGKGTSDKLPVGSHHLMVSGKTCAAQSIPFEVRANETTRVEVHVRAGVRQRFEIGLPETGELASVTLRIQRRGELVARTWASRRQDKPCTGEACLVPGEYTVVARFGGFEGQATFTVGEREGEVVRIAVQVAPK